jgi:hypothetical protein
MTGLRGHAFSILLVGGLALSVWRRTDPGAGMLVRRPDHTAGAGGSVERPTGGCGWVRRRGPLAGAAGSVEARAAGSVEAAHWRVLCRQKVLRSASEGQKNTPSRQRSASKFLTGGRCIWVASSSPALKFARPPADTILPSLLSVLRTWSGRRVSWLGRLDP